LRPGVAPRWLNELEHVGYDVTWVTDRRE
jgi:hypothetical protein